ncbi:cardiolipin synthase [Xanthomarina sp. F2636L]|uniref:cardiolipin synthase n=1 Tax=Xanthomarina sp. F2636L TaxID=2996018 RepID=UPI00225DFCE4|nr:cardiolipin synthase [Xanthomarina sp. F2636L]MCX7550651.1 cardiolipin synthase [Xanthomarina sp. F2636L]
MNYLLILEIIYVVVLMLVSYRVIVDTENTTKTLAYLLLVFFVPIIGMIIYFSFGVNYRIRKMYDKKLMTNENLQSDLEKRLISYSKEVLSEGDETVQDNKKLVNLVLKENLSPLTDNNQVTLLLNGEDKFPEVLKCLAEAKDHIHIEYYIFEDDNIGTQIINLLIEKVAQGLEVRFIYDDFGSRSIRKKQVKILKDGGVKVFPFYKIKLIAFANRINYRNHRKIIVIDGHTSFVGGINVSDRYINTEPNKNKVYWRDTHLKIVGPATWYLQYLFLCDWNFCAQDQISINNKFFPKIETFEAKEDKHVQITASGPDSDVPTIKFALLQAINLAEKEVLITTPYFIPSKSIMDAILISAKSSVKVKLIVPDKSDSKLVNAAACSYYEALLKSGVEIYRYKKGFVHAKTVVIDNEIAIVGTANMDVRSFDLNFEVNAIVYDDEIAHQLRTAFYNDLEDTLKIDLEAWQNRSLFYKFLDKFARLFSPML